MPYIIGTCGFIGTASSAASDFLREFEENQAIDKFEFKIAYMTDGLDDLRYHLTTGSMKYENGFVAIRRFRKMVRGYAGRPYSEITNGEFEDLSDTFISNIIQGEWAGNYNDPVIDPVRNICSRLLKKVKFYRLVHNAEIKQGKEICLYPMQKVCYAINPTEFDIFAREYTSSIINAIGRKDGKNVILDQPFAGNNPQAGMRYYENPLAIVVDRDPRDLFTQCVLQSYFRGERQYPIRDTHMFCDLYRRMRDNMPYKEADKSVLNIHFEDLVYNYEETTEKIKKFCKLEKHLYPKKYFDPAMSANNTMLFKRHEEIMESIRVIEKELPEYLYDYDNVGQYNYTYGDPFVDNPNNRAGRKWKAN